MKHGIFAHRMKQFCIGKIVNFGQTIRMKGNSPDVFNPDQHDSDDNGKGDVCNLVVL
jgi:hypothetical protein